MTQQPGRLPRPHNTIIDDIQNVECSLSPENLTCDGELPPAQVAQKRKRLMAQRAALVQELGREPTTTELYSR